MLEEKLQLLARGVQDFICCLPNSPTASDSDSCIEPGAEEPDQDRERLKCLEETLWEVLCLLQEQPFETAKGLEYTYHIKGNEMFVSRKDKSLTRATVSLAFQNALLLQQSGNPITGPKKLKTFGASYLYPIFIRIGVILAEQ